LDAVANAALIDARECAAAQQAAHEVPLRVPAVHDCHKCLGRFYQAKGNYHQSADCYRKLIAFARNEPHFYDPHFIDHFQDLIDRLESQAAAADCACRLACLSSLAGCSAVSRHPRLRRGACLTPLALRAVLSAGRHRGMALQSHQGMP